MSIVKRAKRSAPSLKHRVPKESKRRLVEEDEVSSESEFDVHSDEFLSDDGDFEDTQAKSYREAKAVLERLKAVDDLETAGSDTDDVDYDAISHRLKRSATKNLTKTHRKLAEVISYDADRITKYKAHRFSPLCLAISNDSRFIVSCSKDGSVVKYDSVLSKKVQIVKRGNSLHKGAIKALAISGDDKYLVTGGDDCIVRIWSFISMRHIKDLTGHRGQITSLTFRRGSNELFSCSTDRSVRAWNLDQMGLVEVMFGHADSVAQLDMLYKPNLLSAGSTDRTVHLFKIEHSSQLVFNGFSDCMSIDTVSMINDEHFISGQMDGSICLWALAKKKPICIVKCAHGVHEDSGETRWITAVRAVPYSDVVFTGSSNGKLVLWRIGDGYKSLLPIDTISLSGFINDIRISNDGKLLACALGQEHKSGRWWKDSKASNSVILVRLFHGEEDREGKTSAGSPISNADDSLSDSE